MGFLKKNDKNGDSMGSDVNEILVKVKKYEASMEFHSYIIKELHKCIDWLLPKITQDNSIKPKEAINELVLKFTSSENPKKLEHFFEKYKKIVNSTITNGIKHLIDKEKEFKEIIKMLSEGIASISSDNRDFNTDILKHSSKLRDLNLLDDIIRIKEGLAVTVSEISEVIKKKSEQDTGNLKSLSEKVSMLNEDLKKAVTDSMTDKLSGTFNRLAFDNHLNRLVHNMGMRWASFSIIMIDIDNFKEVNDTYGHLVGDRVIIATAQKCKTVLRKNDFIARYGGEEFVIILDGSPLKIAERKANEICKSISVTNFVIDKAKPSDSLSYTVSVGISTFRDGDTAHSIVNRADKALYKAKKTGKNRVVTEKDI